MQEVPAYVQILPSWDIMRRIQCMYRLTSLHMYTASGKR